MIASMVVACEIEIYSRATMMQEGHQNPTGRQHLPMSRQDMEDRGWDQVDVVFVTGDAYVDHPSFAMAVLTRSLEAAGFRVGIISQPDWRSSDDFAALGMPRLFWAISAGNMDSMINHMTANRKRRNDDAYTPAGESGRRPDRATAVYSQRCREVGKGKPIVIGGVEASLRRVAHYDYWSDTVRPSMMESSKADLLVFGMGEALIVEIAQRLDAGSSLPDIHDLRGTAYLLGKHDSLPAFSDNMRHDATPSDATRELPSYEEVVEDNESFCRATAMVWRESSPFNGRRLTQRHGDRLLVINPPSLPLGTKEMDRIYDLPFAREAHPSYTGDIPAWEMIKNSITIMRGCFGGCTFCSITAHQGRVIQSRSEESILREVDGLRKSRGFTGFISDIGGPTANMYRMRCKKPEVEAVCRRLSCVHPTLCKLLDTSHGPLKDLMQKTRQRPHVKRALVASGIRTDLAQLDPEYVRDLSAHHVGGQLKVAPEHTHPDVLKAMKKPAIDDFEAFMDVFADASEKAGKQQSLVPYFIASHPGSGLEEMLDLALFLKRTGLRPDAVQDFIPAPMDIATAMYHTGLDPFTLQPVKLAKHLRDRRLQRALLQFFKPENYFEVRRALQEMGREDLIGSGPEALIGSRPPREAVAARESKRKSAGSKDRNKSTIGYRPKRRGRNGK